MKVSEVTFPCGELCLEGVLGLPDGEAPFPAVVVCHPHPLNGGSMHNNVVNSICKALVRASIVALKFNFRGVGGSQGAHSGGIGEQEDVLAAVSYISDLAEVDAGRVGVAGYSAGSAYSMPVAVREDRIRAFAAVSPALEMADFSPLRDCLKPRFLISGGSDELTPARRFLQFCQELVEPKECHIIEGADHFWVGYEEALAARVADFFTRALSA